MYRVVDRVPLALLRFVVSRKVLFGALVTAVLSSTLTLPNLYAVFAQTRPRNSQRQPAAKPKPSPPPTTGIDSIGPPPPIPKLVKKQEPEPEVNPGEVITVQTAEVMLPVTVRDSTGRFISDLTRNDFRVFEDQKLQPLSDFAIRQTPVDVTLMIDTSSSVAEYLEDFRRAAEAFAARLSADDRISLIKFDDRIELLQDWTKSRFQLKRALNRIEPGMFTRFNDALLVATRDLFASVKSRKAIIILTDGIDSRGTTSLESVLTALLQAQVAVYVVSSTEIQRARKQSELDILTSGTEATIRFNQLRIDDLREGLRVLDLSEANLQALAQATGARIYKPRNFDSLDAAYNEVAEELRNQFTLYYTPLNKSRDGSFRRVRVETVNPAYRSHTRMGYFAPKPS
jgi:Ca-activated chloride channel homolog